LFIYDTSQSEYFSQHTQAYCINVLPSPT